MKRTELMVWCLKDKLVIWLKQFAYLDLVCVTESASATETQFEWKFVMSKFPDIWAQDNKNYVYLNTHVISGKDALSWARVKEW